MIWRVRSTPAQTCIGVVRILDYYNDIVQQQCDVRSARGYPKMHLKRSPILFGKRVEDLDLASYL